MMSIEVEVIIKAGEWPEAATGWALEAARALSEEIGVRDACACACLLTDDAEIRALNAAHRGKDKATNVLSWPSVDYTRVAGGRPRPLRPHGGELGDLAFGYETCVKEAEVIGLENHFKHLVIHGVLHLLGYDHENEKDAEIMEALEIRALSRLDISDPYSEGRL